MQTRQNHRGKAKLSSWTARYHKEQIADLERQINWHRSRISAQAKPLKETK